MWPFRKREDRSLTLDQLLAEDQPNTASGATVTTDTAQRLSAVWACIRLLTDVVSTMPCHAYTAGAPDPVDPAPIMLRSPAAGVPFHDWIAQVLRSLLLTVNVAGDGTVTYRLDGREVDRDDLWHLRAYPTPGALLGLSPIAYAAETIGVGLAAQAYGAQYFRDSSTPTGYLTGDQLLTTSQAEEVLARWEVRHKHRRATAVLGKGLEFKQIMVPPEESQFSTPPGSPSSRSAASTASHPK